MSAGTFATVASKPARFKRDRRYVGIKRKYKDSFGAWRDGLTAHYFTGRPFLGVEPKGASQ